MSTFNDNRSILLISLLNILLLIGGFLYLREVRAEGEETRRMMQALLKNQRGVVLGGAVGGTNQAPQDPAAIEESFRRVLGELLRQERSTVRAAIKVTNYTNEVPAAGAPRVEPQERRQAMENAEKLLAGALDDGVWSKNDALKMQIYTLKLGKKQQMKIRKRFYGALNQGTLKPAGPSAIMF